MSQLERQRSEAMVKAIKQRSAPPTPIPLSPFFFAR